MRVIASWCCASVLLAATVQAQRIRWFCPPMSVNQDSTGAGIDAGFTFELGVFDTGFTPTPENRHAWLAHWHAAQTTAYAPSGGNTGAFLDEFENDVKSGKLDHLAEEALREYDAGECREL